MAGNTTPATSSSKKKEDKAKKELSSSDQTDKEKDKAKIDPRDDPRNYDFPVGFGNAYVEFTSVSEAKKARRNIHLLKYAGRTVECEFHDEIRFEANDFKPLQPVQIEERAQEFEGVENLAIEFTEPRQSEPLAL